MEKFHVDSKVRLEPNQTQPDQRDEVKENSPSWSLPSLSGPEKEVGLSQGGFGGT